MRERLGRNDEQEEDDGEGWCGRGYHHSGLNCLCPPDHEARSSEEPDDDQDAEEDECGDLVEGDWTKLPVFLLQQLRQAGLGLLRPGSSFQPGDPPAPGRTEEVELEDDPDEGEVKEDVRYGEEEP